MSLCWHTGGACWPQAGSVSIIIPSHAVDQESWLLPAAWKRTYLPGQPSFQAWVICRLHIRVVTCVNAAMHHASAWSALHGDMHGPYLATHARSERSALLTIQNDSGKKPTAATVSRCIGECQTQAVWQTAMELHAELVPFRLTTTSQWATDC